MYVTLHQKRFLSYHIHENMNKSDLKTSAFHKTTEVNEKTSHNLKFSLCKRSYEDEKTSSNLEKIFLKCISENGHYLECIKNSQNISSHEQISNWKMGRG